MEVALHHRLDQVEAARARLVPKLAGRDDVVAALASPGEELHHGDRERSQDQQPSESASERHWGLSFGARWRVLDEASQFDGCGRRWQPDSQLPSRGPLAQSPNNQLDGSGTSTPWFSHFRPLTQRMIHQMYKARRRNQPITTKAR